MTAPECYACMLRYCPPLHICPKHQYALMTGIITVSNHDPHRVFPLVPADIVSSTIIAMCAAVGADAGAGDCE